MISLTMNPVFGRRELGRNYMQMKFHGHDQINMYGRYFLAQYCPKTQIKKKTKRSAEDHYLKIESFEFLILIFGILILILIIITAEQLYSCSGIFT